MKVNKRLGTIFFLSWISTLGGVVLSAFSAQFQTKIARIQTKIQTLGREWDYWYSKWFTFILISSVDLHSFRFISIFHQFCNIIEKELWKNELHGCESWRVAFCPILGAIVFIESRVIEIIWLLCRFSRGPSLANCIVRLGWARSFV